MIKYIKDLDDILAYVDKLYSEGNEYGLVYTREHIDILIRGKGACLLLLKNQHLEIGAEPEVLGSIMGVPEELDTGDKIIEINWLCIPAKHRRNGFAAKLITSSIEYFTKLGYTKACYVSDYKTRDSFKIKYLYYPLNVGVYRKLNDSNITETMFKKVKNYGNPVSTHVSIETNKVLKQKHLTLINSQGNTGYNFKKFNINISGKSLDKLKSPIIHFYFTTKSGKYIGFLCLSILTFPSKDRRGFLYYHSGDMTIMLPALVICDDFKALNLDMIVTNDLGPFFSNPEKVELLKFNNVLPSRKHLCYYGKFGGSNPLQIFIP